MSCCCRTRAFCAFCTFYGMVSLGFRMRVGDGRALIPHYIQRARHKGVDRLSVSTEWSYSEYRIESRCWRSSDMPSSVLGDAWLVFHCFVTNRCTYFTVILLFNSMIPAGCLIFFFCLVSFAVCFLLFACHRAVQAVGGICVGDGAQIQRHQAQQRGSQK